VDFQSSEDLLSFMSSMTAVAAFNAALEERLFWRLAEGAESAAEISGELGIPPRRCAYWLDLLVRIGLLERSAGRYAPSATARELILDAYVPEVWMQLAIEQRERFPILADLPQNLRSKRSAWELLGRDAPDYLEAMRDDPQRARRFTRMLGELHGSLSRFLASEIDPADARKIMDLGGGSGVISLALLAKHPGLSAVVVDLPLICDAGREFARTHPAGDRLSFHDADFLADPLPGDFDLILECDVNVYGIELFRKLRSCLAPGGRLLIVDLLAPAEGEAPGPRVDWALRHSLADPDFVFPSVGEVSAELQAAGFVVNAPRTVLSGWTLLEARPLG